MYKAYTMIGLGTVTLLRIQSYNSCVVLAECIMLTFLALFEK